MLRTDKPIYKVILIFNLVLIAAALVFSVLGIFNQDVTVLRVLCCVLSIATLIVGAFYIIKGYTKNASKYYKLFAIFFGANQILQISTRSVENANTFLVVSSVIALCIIFVTVLILDLGKSKSFILCGVLVALMLFNLIFTIASGYSIPPILHKVVDLDIACLYGIFTYAKYLDKTERGTK